MNKMLFTLACTLCGIALAFSSQDSLFMVQTKPKTINFHTPVFTSGYYLPTHITNNIDITPNMGTVIIAGSTVIEKGFEVTIHPGTTVAVHEYGSIIVKGNLKIIGTHALPVHFVSNEMREENRTWSGILFEEGSSGTIMNAIFHHASPALSCSKNANVTITNTLFAFGNLAVFGPCSYTP